MDLPGWQALHERLGVDGPVIVTVALDNDPSEAVPWIDAATPTHPSLIDAAHQVDEKFGIMNVPSSVWIDEAGMIVRPAEPAWPGSTPITDMASILDQLPPGARRTVELIERMNIAPEQSLGMVLDWAEVGADSTFVLDPDEVVARSRPRLDDFARAAAHFELGTHFEHLGDHAGAAEHWRLAHRLDSDNWTYKRQAWSIETGSSLNRTDTYDGDWLTDVAAIGPENYYPPLR
jgi:hypothetical protein